jgi:hypothetical protein
MQPTKFRCLQSYPELANAKTLCWHRFHSSVVALGFGNGRTVVAGINNDQSITLLADTPNAYPRTLTGLSFSPSDLYLAGGFERSRSDHGLHIYDVSELLGSPLRAVQTTVLKPCLQLGFGEGLSSLCWYPDSSHRLLAGMGYKWLRCYDIRGARAY